jgi:hypothetical protein
MPLPRRHTQLTNGAPQWPSVEVLPTLAPGHKSAPADSPAPANGIGNRGHQAAQPVDLDQTLWRPLGKHTRLRNNQGGKPKCASASLLRLSALLS